MSKQEFSWDGKPIAKVPLWKRIWQWFTADAPVTPRRPFL